MSLVGKALFFCAKVEDSACHLTLYLLQEVCFRFGIIYQSEYWIGPSAELRIITISLGRLFPHNHPQTFFRSSRLYCLSNGPHQLVVIEIVQEVWLYDLILLHYYCIFLLIQTVLKQFMLLYCTKNCHLRQVLLETAFTWLYFSLLYCLI